MDEEVARDAGAVVAIVAPAEQAHRLERDFRGAARGSDPNRQCCGEASGGMEYCHAPMAELRSHHASIMLTADGAALQQVLRFLIDDGADALAADLQDTAGLLLRVDHAGGRRRSCWTIGFSQ